MNRRNHYRSIINDSDSIKIYNLLYYIINKHNKFNQNKFSFQRHELSIESKHTDMDIKNKCLYNSKELWKK